MEIQYDENTKALPNDQLHRLFVQAGWADAEEAEHLHHFNNPFVHSTLVVSAWEGERLVGAVRVLSDRTVRSIVYDLVVDPDYRGRGIAREMLRRCRAHFPDSEWLVQTTQERKSFYEEIGFHEIHDVFLRIPSRYF